MTGSDYLGVPGALGEHCPGTGGCAGLGSVSCNINSVITCDLFAVLAVGISLCA